MAILSGKQVIKLAPNLIVELQENETFNIEYSIDGYSICIDFNINLDLGASINNETELGVYLVDTITIVASKEVGNTPDIPTSESGGRDFTTLRPYFDIKQNEFSPIIKESLKRIIFFFKYTLNQPFLDSVNLKNNELHGIQWFDDAGHEYGALTLTFNVCIPSINESLGVLPYRAGDSDILRSSLMCENEENLTSQILSDSQAAILGGNLRRGVFEMAVTCELSVKRTFFSKHSFAGDAFEYLEDKGKVKISVLEFISKVSNDVFGESFKELQPDSFECIDYLFRCRNKIAHRGELVFRDTQGTLQVVNNEMAKKWYLAVRQLLNWLQTQLDNAD